MQCLTVCVFEYGYKLLQAYLNERETWKFQVPIAITSETEDRLNVEEIK